MPSSTSNSTKINWFPGHMNRARREIGEAIAKAHVVIELVDGRLPFSSRNPLLHELATDKPILTVLAKSDLADPVATADWQDAWPGERPLALAMSDHKSVRAIPKRCRELAPGRGGPGRTLRTLVVGIPNVGKSTLINTLIGRRIAKVGDRPAITRRAARFELDSDLSIFDSPGVLWPKLDDQEGAHRLAASGAIGAAAFELVDVAGWAVCFVAARYREELTLRFNLHEEIDDILGSTSDDPGDASRAVALLEAVGRKRGALRSGGYVDLDRAADLFLRDLRAGKVGPISFERPEDFPGDHLGNSPETIVDPVD
ncbi:MAG: ribosome biogenesis GTPase YlqF [Myxococcales bacterium]|nr:ribosome biogenesis GTPase YlqF [Myxococcales bacterium]HIK84909.1 ribosome biogenesis GTPase YlqF [Myxococcales bacterium]